MTKEEKQEIAQMIVDGISRAKRIDVRARELGIPQLRIDEGFKISPGANDEYIDLYLKDVAKNYPQEKGLPDVSEEDMAQAASLLVR